MVEKIKYQVRGIQRLYNQETHTVENEEMLATVIIPYSEENEQKASSVAYDGKYEIIDADSEGF